MTTIVFDGKTMAADRAQSSGIIYRPVAKIAKIKMAEETILVGFCGSAPFADSALSFLAGRGPKPDCDFFEINPSEELGLIASSSGELFLLSASFNRLKIEEPIGAIGSGYEIAYGALAAGADAQRAVEIVCQRASGSGLGVDTLSFTADELAPPRMAQKGAIVEFPSAHAPSGRRLKIADENA